MTGCNPVTCPRIFGVIQIFFIKDNLVAPKIIGEVMGLHPVIVILSLLVCAKFAGIVGVLFAIPLASMINVVLRYLQEKEIQSILHPNRNPEEPVV